MSTVQTGSEFISFIHFVIPLKLFLLIVLYT